MKGNKMGQKTGVEIITIAARQVAPRAERIEHYIKKTDKGRKNLLGAAGHPQSFSIRTVA